MFASSSTSSPASAWSSEQPPDDAAILAAALVDGLRPDPALTVSAWADEHRMLSGRTASERGRWRTARTPYLREPFDLLSATSPVLRVVIKKASQLGFTEGAVNWLGYTIHCAPGPFLFVEPTVEVGKRLSRQKIDTAIAESAVLRARVAAPRSRFAANTMLLKEFPGGLVVITGANSAAGLCYTTCRYAVLDDVDRYPRSVEGEGSPIGLVEARTQTFGVRRKELLMSSPTLAGLSVIDGEWEKTDQRRYFVPCPHCGAFQVLEFPRLEWEPGRPKTARYRCAECREPIREASKTRMLARGEWRATKPSPDPSVAGFHINALYCPVGWLSWAGIAAKAEEAAGDPQKLQTFTNTVLGETYATPSEAPDWHRLRERQTANPLGVVPPGVLFLTGGTDIQRDRLEVSVWGWGRGLRSWLIDHQVLEGDPAGEDSWAALTALCGRTWPTAGGLAMPLAKMAVDTGFSPAPAHRWARTQPPERAMLVRGGPPGPTLVSLPRAAEAIETRGHVRRRRRGLRVWTVNVHALRLELYGWLHLDAPAPGMPTPAGWVSLPAVGDEFLQQLVAQALVRRVVKGVEKLEWVNVHRRDEAGDCRNYARAAAHVVGIDRFTEDDWRRLEAPFGTTPPPAAPSDPAPAPTAPGAAVVPPPGGAPSGVTWRRSDYLKPRW
jgi:phage terminase large subunit GpA-like protein